MTQKFDPITREIVQNALSAICEEMFLAIQRTAMSTVVYEIQDYSTSIMAPDGQAAAQGMGIPIFVGAAEFGVKGVIKKFGYEKIRPGDVFITNDPWDAGGSHLNDITLLMPVFAEGMLVAWTSNKAHWNDIGGMQPGSMPLNATEVFQEGMQIPVLKIIDEGEPIQGVIDLLTANSRIPDYTLGDLWACISAVRIGERRVVELAKRYGAPALLEAMEQYLDYGEKIVRQEFKTLPKGVFEAEDVDEEFDGEKIRVKITITDDEFIVDFRNNPKQRAKAVNNTARFTELTARLIYKAFVDPSLVCSGGMYRPLRVITEPGTVFAAEYPSPVSWHAQPLNYAADLIWKALAPVMPTRLPAGHHGSACGLFITSVHPDTGHYHTSIEPHPGGWGGSPGLDGQSAQFCVINGDTVTGPAEINEARNGLIIENYGFHDKDGGAGQFRGGRGVHVAYRLRADDASVTAVMTPRFKTQPWSLEGGEPGCSNAVEIEYADGSREKKNLISNELLHKGDCIHIYTAHGGGYGDPKERDPALVRADIEDGYITAEQAKSMYGLDSLAAE